MKVLWIKKTIYRRYLIDNDESEGVIKTINGDPENAINMIEEFYNKNTEIEYDEEKTIRPIEYSIDEEIK